MRFGRAVAAGAPLIALAIVLGGYLCAHVDDGDSLFYGRMADRLVASGDWWHLSWTDTQLTAFHDHLPAPIWLIALLRTTVGPWGARVVYAFFAWLTWLLLYRLASRHGFEREAWYGLWLVVFTESWLHWQTCPRTDQPSLLAMVGALAVIRPGVAWRTAVSALLVGVTILLRLPSGLALMVLVPALVIAQRAEATEPLARLKDVMALPRFWFGALVLPLAFHLANGAFSDGIAWPEFLSTQVFPSLSGARTDGQTSHLAPLVTLARRFWPGLAFLTVGVGVLVARADRRRPFVLFCSAWVLAIFGGLMLGRRHLPHHIWPAYPALMILCGVGVRAIVDRWGDSWPRLRRALPVALGLSALGFAISVAIQLRPAACDVRAAAQTLSMDGYCPTVVIATADPDPKNWTLGSKVVDHFNRDVVFLGREQALPATGCMPLIAGESNVPARQGWELVHAGRRVNFFRGPAD
jgi:hypothetical protein